MFELYTSTPDGASNNVKVSGTLVTGGNTFNNSWVSDSSRLVYRADQDSDNVFDLYTSTPDGTSNVKISGTATAGAVGVTSSLVLLD